MSQKCKRKKSSSVIIPRTTFARIVKSISKDKVYSGPLKWSRDGLHVLQEVVENYTIECFKQGKDVADRLNHKTLSTKHFCSHTH